uniref:Uncharacterized protein n=1 Tax=Macrostomum lignano TaxID=282301 RepID=A0A1I8I5J4_9PLAT
MRLHFRVYLRRRRNSPVVAEPRPEHRQGASRHGETRRRRGLEGGDCQVHPDAGRQRQSQQRLQLR